MATQIAVRRDTTANWMQANPVLGSGEPAYDSALKQLRIGDGVTKYLDLPALSGVDAAYVVSLLLNDTSVSDALNSRYVQVLTPSGADDGARITGALVKGDVILRGSFLLSSTVVVPSARKISSFGSSKITWTGLDDTNYFFTANANTNIEISGIEFVGKSNRQAAITALGGSHITLHDNRMKNCRIGSFYAVGGASATYAQVTANNRGHHIVVADNVAFGSAQADGFACVEFIYCDDWAAHDNYIDTYQHGIQWWGGDANNNRDGAIANERKNARGVTHGNRVKNIAGGGVWGSMGLHHAIGPDHVENCSDVGIDLEGCVDCTVFVGYVANCKNGNLATFFASQGINFVGGTSSQSSATQQHFETYNSTSDPQQSPLVTYQGVQFITRGGFVGFGGANFGPVQNFAVVDCVFQNTKLRMNSGSTTIKVSNNRFNYTVASDTAFEAVYLGASNNNGVKDISGNLFTTSVGQPAGTLAIKTLDNDFNSNPLIRIERNTLWEGPGGSIFCAWAGQNAGPVGRYFIKDNVCYGITVTSQGAAAAATVRAIDNFTKYMQPVGATLIGISG